MPSNAYLQIHQLLAQLTQEEREQLLEEINIVIESEEAESLHDIMEFEGFVEELWKDVDVDA